MANQYFFRLTISYLIAFNCINSSTDVNNLKHYVSTERIEAEDYTFAINGYEMYNDCTDPDLFYLDELGSTTIIAYLQVDFLDGMNSIVLRVANMELSSPIDISFHLVNSTNPPFLTISAPSTGNDRCAFTSLNVDLDGPLTGVHDLYITFPSSVQSAIHLDWFVFSRTTTKIATEKIEAEDFTSQSDATIYVDCTDDPNLSYVGSLAVTSFIGYQRVDFGSGVGMVTFRVSSGYTGGAQDIELHLENTTNTPFATVPVGQTGNQRCDFLTLSSFLDTRPSGVQDLYLTFPSSPGNYIHLDWFLFNQTFTQQ